MFLDPDTTLILLYEKNRLIGLTFAFPYTKFNDRHKENEGEKTAYIYATVLEAEKRKKGLVKHLNQAMDHALKNKGYTHERRDAKVEYAEKLMRNYGERATAGEIEDRFGLGGQRHLVVDIRGSDPSPAPTIE